MSQWSCCNIVHIGRSRFRNNAPTTADEPPECSIISNRGGVLKSDFFWSKSNGVYCIILACWHSNIKFMIIKSKSGNLIQVNTVFSCNFENGFKTLQPIISIRLDDTTNQPIGDVTQFSHKQPLYLMNIHILTKGHSLAAVFKKPCCHIHENMWLGHRV